jgi:hypothetical protein
MKISAFLLSLLFTNILLAAPDMSAKNCIFVEKSGSTLFGPFDENSQASCVQMIQYLESNPNSAYPDVMELLQSFNGSYFVRAVPSGNLQFYMCMACGYEYSKPCELEDDNDVPEPAPYIQHKYN